MQYWTGKGYGLSYLTDITGRPLLTYQGPDDKSPILLADRVAQTFDFTVRQNLIAGAMRNDRMDSGTASAAKKLLGGGPDDELDHKISLELGGANTPANLFIQPGITAGASAASDTLENNLALDVVAGKISLLDAWRTLEDQKGFLLVEDMQTAKKVAIAPLLIQLAGNLKDYITGNKKAAIGVPTAQLKTKMDQLLADLAKAPLDQSKMESLFTTQVQINQQTLNVSSSEAAQATKTVLAAYAESKGIDPREIIGATNANIQRIIANSKATPNIFGVSTITVAAILTGLAGILASVGIVAFAVGIIGVIMVGPEAIAGALTGGLFESIGGLIGVSPLAAAGFGTLAVSEAVAAMLFLIGQGIKTIYDQGYLLPTQNIGAIKDALSIQKGLAGFLPSQSAAPGTGGSSSGASGAAGAPTPQPQYTPASGNGTIDGSWTFQNGKWVLTSPAPAAALPSGGAAAAGATQLFIGHIDAGNLKAVAPYAPSEFPSINSADDLALAAQSNLGAFLSAIPGIIDYQIKTKTSVTGANGTELIGSVVRKQKGTTKKGVPTYKNVTNQFAVAEVFIKTSAKGRVKIEEIILGPIDETRYKPTPQQLADLGNQLDQKLISTNVANITAVTFNPIAAPAAAPATTTPPSPAAVAPAPAAAPAPSIAAAAPAAPVVQAPTISTSSTSVLGQGTTQFFTYLGTSYKRPEPYKGLSGDAANTQYLIDQGIYQPPAAAIASGYPRNVTVNVSTLYVRSAPTTSAALAGSQKLVMGNQFQVTGYVHGENVSGEDRWWISSRGNYVWTGGTQEKP